MCSTRACGPRGVELSNTDCWDCAGSGCAGGTGSTAEIAGRGGSGYAAASSARLRRAACLDPARPRTVKGAGTALIWRGEFCRETTNSGT
jgi:hypothetical protein